MSRLNHLIHQIRFLLRNLQFGEVWEKLLRRAYSESVSYGLRRDITIPFEGPAPKIPIQVRPLQPADVPRLLDVNAPRISEETVKELIDRKSFVEKGVGTCYVAVDPKGNPCYMQWLIGANENESLAKIFNGGFPRLAPDEALLEDAFTPETYRGLGIMPAAMAQIAVKAKDIGARHVSTFVFHNNIPSLKGCKRAGFYPYLVRRDRWLLFRRRLTFTPLPQGTPYSFDAKAKEEASMSCSPNMERRGSASPSSAPSALPETESNQKKQRETRLTR